VKVITEA